MSNDSAMRLRCVRDVAKMCLRYVLDVSEMFCDVLICFQDVSERVSEMWLKCV